MSGGVETGSRAGGPRPRQSETILAGVRTRMLAQAGDEPPALLLHGFSDSADTWRPLLRELAARGRGAVALDLPHFGRAGRPRDRPLLPAWDRFVAAAVRELGGGEPVVLAGNSLGGLLAMRAAGDPELPVGGVVAIGPAGLGLQPWVGIVRRVGAALALLSRARTPERATSLAAARVYARLAAVGPLEQDVLAHYASHVRAGDVGRIMALAVEVLRELSLDDALDVAAIGCPLSLVWGERDMLCPPGGARLITEVHAEATLRVFEGVGHCAQLERPAEIAEVVCAMEAPVSR